jgi:putative transposase
VRAWDRFFKGMARPPKFKKRSGSMAVDILQASKLNIVRLNHRLGEVTIPLIGRVRFRWTRPLAGISPGCAGRITGARLIKKALGWHICFRIEEPAIKVAPNRGPSVGIDRGVVHTMAISDGEMLDMPRLLSPGEEHRLQALERKAARQQLARKAVSRGPSDRTAPTIRSLQCAHGKLADVTTGSTRPPPGSPRTTA